MSDSAREKHLGQIYANWANDRVVHVVTLFAGDVGARSHLYPGLSKGAREALAELREKLRQTPGWPDRSERLEIYRSTLSVEFYDTLNSLLRTISRLIDSGEDTRARSVLQRVVADDIEVFRSTFATSHTDVLKARSERLEPVFEHVWTLLSEATLASTFGIQSVKGEKRGGGMSAATAQLVEIMSGRLSGASAGFIPIRQLMLAHRMASHGCAVLEQLLTSDRKDDDQMFEDAYAWARALDELLPVSTILDAWHSPSASRALDEIALAHLPPSPAGNVNLPAFSAYLRTAGSLGNLDTQTIVWERCCSTGDFSCAECGPTKHPGSCTAFGTATCSLICALHTNKVNVFI